MNGTNSICIVQPSLNAVSETFLRAHAERLPANVTVVTGSLAHISGAPVRSQSLPSRIARKARRLATGARYVPDATASYLQAFERCCPALVLAEYGPTGVHVMEACRLAGLPLVVHFHGYDASMHAVLAEHHASYPALFRQAAAIVVVSRAMEKALRDLGAPHDKLFVNCCGVDVERFRDAIPERAPPTFVTVGRFIDKKAPHLTILSFERVYRSRPEARLRMIGDGPLLGACHDLVKGLNLEEAVTLLGSQPHEVIEEELRSARAFAQHSVTATSGDAEGTPVSVIEACASGLPVVATRHAGIPDVVLNHKTGLLVEEHDVDGMSAAMLTLVDQPRFAAALGQAARVRIQENFSMERSIQRLWSIIEACLPPESTGKVTSGAV